MRKFLASLILVVAVPAVAQAQCLLCLGIGYMLGSSSSSTTTISSDGGAVIYSAPMAAERVTDPLSVRMATTSREFENFDPSRKEYSKGKTFQQIFNEQVERPDQYVILQVMRVLNSEHQAWAEIWFTYIERSKFISLDSLRSLQSKASKPVAVARKKP